MAIRQFDRVTFRRASLSLLSVFIGVHVWVLAPAASAQQSSDQEVAVNLAEGRVVICAAKDAIVLAAMGTRGEAGSRPPGIVAISPVRIGVMMGAVEWVRPDSSDRPVQLDGEFKGLVAQALSGTNQKDEAFHASDIESIGIAVLERLRVLAAQLHHKINLGDDEPLVRVVLAGWVPNYGAEAWVIDYQIQQDALGNDLWRTRVSRPRYNQLYPPEKGKPKTLMESPLPAGESRRGRSRTARPAAAERFAAGAISRGYSAAGKIAGAGRRGPEPEERRRQPGEFLEGRASGDRSAGNKIVHGQSRLRQRISVDHPAAESSRSPSQRKAQ